MNCSRSGEAGHASSAADPTAELSGAVAARPIHLHDRASFARRLERDRGLHLYGLGDLDPVFWPYTTWLALLDRGEAAELALLYSGGSLPVLLALSENGAPALRPLVRGVIGILPRRFYAHLTRGLAPAFAPEYRVVDHGLYARMVLIRPRLEVGTPGEVVPLGMDDLGEIAALYEVAYPEGWFEPAMLERGVFRGIRAGGRLVAVAGTHVVSKRTRVAAIGGVATHPEHRGKGLATAVCARLCRDLLSRADTIGLNVAVGNAPARACYDRLGFEVIAEYGEHMVEAALP
jgi:ribosomal protein S18 acetylase RimI-like enzyme